MTASETIERIEARCREISGHSETWFFEKKRYFFEEKPEDEPDGAIVGDICEQKGKIADIVSLFRIEPNGEISQGEFGFKALLVNSPSQIEKVVEEKEEIIEVVNVKAKTIQENPIVLEQEPLLRIMDASQIGMVETDNDIIKASMMVKPFWGIEASDITDHERKYKKLNLLGHTREKAVYPLKYLLELAKFADKNKATHLEMEIGTNRPLKVSFKTLDSKGEEKITSFYLAPRVDI